MTFGSEILIHFFQYTVHFHLTSSQDSSYQPRHSNCLKTFSSTEYMGMWFSLSQVEIKIAFSYLFCRLGICAWIHSCRTSLQLYKYRVMWSSEIIYLSVWALIYFLLPFIIQNLRLHLSVSFKKIILKVKEIGQVNIVTFFKYNFITPYPNWKHWKIISWCTILLATWYTFTHCNITCY